MIFHKLCEKDFVPFTLHKRLAHFPNPSEFAHSWKRPFKSWEMILFSQLATAAQFTTAAQRMSLAPFSDSAP